MTRPYIQKSIIELEDIFSRSQNNQVILNALLEELSNRKTSRALSLREKVTVLISSLEEIQAEPQAITSIISSPDKQDAIRSMVPNEILTAQAVLELIVAFAFVDGHLHPQEVQVLKEICKSLEIPESDLQDKIQKYQNSPENHEALYEEAFAAIDSKYAQERLIGYLCDIATADEDHHPKELHFLNTVKEKWGLNLSIGKKLKWDEDQKSVIHADSKDRMLVYAGPGMGKTAVACARVSDLIDQNIEPGNIWMLSFTRTAVKEIKDRIACFSNHNLSAIGIRISTIDSKAWRLRYGLTDDEISNFFGSYETNIEEVIKLFDTHKEELYEYFDTLEHVIIDEAQDITGARAELIIRILKMLNPNCGFTVFADPAQAIYGFTHDQDGHEPENKTDFLKSLKEKFSTELKEKELKTIHRTNNPHLVKLIEDLRLDIYVNDNVEEDQYVQRRELIKEHADQAGPFNAKEVLNQDSTLVLFRKRSEVLLASYFACEGAVPHRVRMSGHPPCIYSWVGHVFSNYTENKITKEKFFKRCIGSSYLFDSETDESDYLEWWNLLSSVAGTGNDVDVARLRLVLSRRPPINLCYSEYGHKGPILGTIHASKGREADNVILRLPHKTAGSTMDFDEESRVLFVGATRAKSQLKVGESFIRQLFSKSLASGRAFKENKSKEPQNYKLATVEIGLDGDLDEYSFVSKKMTQQEVITNQRNLVKISSQTPHKMGAFIDDQYNYSIWSSQDERGVRCSIGCFDQNLNKDLFGVAAVMGGIYSKNYKPPTDLPGFYVLGIRTVCKPENDPNLKNLHEPYCETGIWTVPVIIGYPNLLFPKRNRR